MRYSRNWNENVFSLIRNFNIFPFTLIFCRFGIAKNAIWEKGLLAAAILVGVAIFANQSPCDRLQIVIPNALVISFRQSGRKIVMSDLSKVANAGDFVHILATVNILRSEHKTYPLMMAMTLMNDYDDVTTMIKTSQSRVKTHSPSFPPSSHFFALAGAFFSIIVWFFHLSLSSESYSESDS